MQDLAWVVAVVLGVAAIVFSWLWLQARMARRAAEQTLHDLGASLGTGSGDFSADAIYHLLAKGKINIDGIAHNFGVTHAEGAAPAPFLSTTNMDHLHPGDSFSTIRGALHKVDTGGAAATVTAPAPARASAPAAAKPAPAPAPAPPEEENFEDVADRTVMFAPSRGAPDPASANPYAGFPFLRVTEGPDTGTDFPLPFTNATIGREKSNIIALGDTGSSRLHCEVTYKSREFVLRDNKSTNGTFCNGEKIDEKVLAFGDSIQVADTVMTFSCDGYEMKDSEPDKAIAAFELCLKKEPNFVLALQNLAFLLERNVARQKEAAPLWKRIMEIDQGR